MRSFSFLSTIAIAMYAAKVQAYTENCANIVNLNVATALGTALGITIPNVAGTLTSVCLCDSGVAAFVAGNPFAQVATTLFPSSTVQSIIMNIVDTYPGHTDCTYPANSVPNCAAQGTCGYACATGFSLCSDGTCKTTGTCPTVPTTPAAGTDTCVNLNNVNIISYLNGALGLTVPNVIGTTVSGCLCLSTIDAFITANAGAFSGLTSQANLESALAALIANSGSVQCVIPTGTMGQCTPSNLCATTCLANLLPCPGGTCALSCTSSTPSRKRGISAQIARMERACPANTELCGGLTGLSSFGCINTRFNLESCGGCVLPVPGKVASGSDCSAIVGVKDVACVKGICVVSACVDGYTVSGDSTSCIGSK